MKFTIFTAIILLLLTACGGNRRQSSRDGFTREEGLIWNTEYHITYAGPEELGDSIRAILNNVGKSLSVFDGSSLVSLVNRQDSTAVDSDFIRVYEMSVKINRVSEGAFDPTLSPLITAWGFGPGHKASPDTARIDSLMNFVGIGKTRLHGGVIVKDDARINFNFSAIAKGYGCDRIGEMFRRNGVKDFLVEIGGEIVASGKNPKGDDWNISVDKPVFSDTAIVHESQSIVSFTDMGMATSGNYRNFRRDATGIYGHTISATTGRPVQTDVLSATVLAPTSMEADALATAFMALGKERSIRLNSRLRLPVMLVCPDTVWTSPQFRRLMK